MFEIANHFIDAAGKYYVRVVLDETEAAFFVFDAYPTQEEVDAAASRYIEAIDGNAGQDQPTNP